MVFVLMVISVFGFSVGMKMKSTESSCDFMKYVQAALVVVRGQRQRASVERICRSLRLQQMLRNVDEKVVEAELEAAVQRGELYAVDKRGYRSYQVENCISIFSVSLILTLAIQCEGKVYHVSIHLILT